MDVILGPLIMIVQLVLNLYVWMLIVQAVMSWLVAFDIINTRNKFVYMVGDFLYRITEPLLRPIRRFLPDLGGIDLSPMVLIFIIIFVQNVIGRLEIRLMGY